VRELSLLFVLVLALASLPSEGGTKSIFPCEDLPQPLLSLPSPDDIREFLAGSLFRFL